MAAKRLSLSAQKRTLAGRGVKTLRSAGSIPANVFGKNVKSLSIAVKKVEFEKLYRTAGETTLIDVHVEGEEKPRPVLIAEVQVHPISDHLLHVNFHQVDLTQKVTADVPVRLVGESPAVKDKGAVLVTVMSALHVEALPGDLPDHVVVDVSKLVEFGDSVHVKDLKIDPEVKVLVGEDETVVTVQEPKEEVEETPVVAAPAEGEAVAGGAAGAPAAGAPAAAGEKKPAEGAGKPEAKKEAPEAKKK